MSSDDFVIQIAQKYRLAISIAILNTKPTNLTIEQYIDLLKTNDDAQDDVLNISACSDDFNIDSPDDIDHQSFINQSRPSQNVEDFHNFNRNDYNDKMRSETQDKETRVNDREIQGYDRQDNEEILVTDRETQDNDRTQFNDEETQGYFETRVNDKSNGKYINTSILQNYEDTSRRIDANQERRDQMREVINVLKDVDVITADKVGIENEGLFCDSLQEQLYGPMDTDLTQCYGTIGDSIDLQNNTDREIYKSYDQKCMQSSQRVHIEVPIDAIRKEKVIVDPGLSLENNTKELRKELKKRLNNNDKMNIPNPKIAKKNHDSKNNNKEEAAGIHTNNITADMNIASNNSLQSARDMDENRMNTQNNFCTEDNTQFNTHFSESQNKVVINNDLIYANKNINKLNIDTKENYKDTRFDILSNRQEIINRDTKNKAINQNSMDNDTVFTSANSMNAFPDNESQMRENFTVNFTSLRDVRLQRSKNIEKDTIPQAKISVLKDEDNTFKTIVFDENENKDENKEDNNIDKDVTDRQTEKIPFKVIEEVNRIKMYLRKETNSSEYRSSQSKSSFGNSQPQNVWICQSGNSVLNYLLCCSLVTATQELTEQISEVLGQLIDRLHAEEFYPPFLEDLLITVEKTLELVYEDDNYGFDMLLKKDEQIQRTLLLNKSTHIQKYTISKINAILQKLLDEISADDTLHDIQNINKIENVCYIFQILHVILPKCTPNSQISAINSQEDRILRKRDITDIWRKKWMPETKKNSNEGSSTNKCVIKECGEILNKIIVKFMDGYSLIAFSALKCFNIMQS